MTAALQAAPRPAWPFADGAVLQRDTPLPVWGTAEPGERITVLHRGHEVSTTTDPEGRWTVLLPAMQADATGAELCIQGATTVRLHDLLVGDVWLFVGETATALRVADCTERAPDDTSGHHALLRFLLGNPTTLEPASRDKEAAWVEPGPANVAALPGCAYFFGRKLLQKTGVPTGLVVLAASPASIDSWLSPTALRNLPEPGRFQELLEAEARLWPSVISDFETRKTRWQQEEAKARNTSPARLADFLQRTPRPVPPQRTEPGQQFNQLLQPLLPYASAGLVLQPRESDLRRNSYYGPLLKSFVHSVRAHFGQAALPVLLVQSGAYAVDGDSTGSSLSRLRAEQQDLALNLPAVELVVSMDLPATRRGLVPNQKEIARRLSLKILRQVHGADVEAEGPRPLQCRLEGRGVIVSFANAHAGLVAWKNPVSALELAGADGQFYTANVTLEGDSLRAESNKVPRPKMLRYAWHNTSQANLANGSGLPAAPFLLQVP